MPSTILEPEVEIPVKEKTEPAYAPKPTDPKRRVRDLLIEIFQGHEEYLGWTPD